MLNLARFNKAAITFRKIEPIFDWSVRIYQLSNTPCHAMPSITRFRVRGAKQTVRLKDSSIEGV